VRSWQSLLLFLTAGLSLLSATSCGQPQATAAPTPLPAVVATLRPSTPAPTVPAEIRRPAVAGQFYPGDPDELRRMVDGLLAGVTETTPGEPIALIVPHAGYIFSGHVAAVAFKQMEGRHYDAVVVIGTNHSDPAFHDVSVWPAGAFETPLGQIPIAEDLAQALINADPRIVPNPNVHRYEHSIEVELPFIQRVCPDCPIVPVIVGAPTMENCRALSDALARALAGRRALIVASSDLSHYPAYEDALQVDGATLAAIESLDPEQVVATMAEQMRRGVSNLGTCACGEGPIITAIMAARKLGANHATVLKYANSGDTPFGDRDRVVGYAAVVFWQGEGNAPAFVAPKPALAPIGSVPLTEEDRQALLRLARQTLEQFLANMTVPWFETTSPGLQQERGVFVTLTRGGELRGCRGDLLGRKPLYLGVQQMSLAAALDDPRFPPVTRDELDELKIEISVLGPIEPVADVSKIQVGVHGLVVVQDDQQGVLLPQVPVEEGWDREEFLEGVCRKAELPAGCWREGARLYAFTAEVFGEER